MNSSSSGSARLPAVATVRVMSLVLPPLPEPTLDVVEDPEGFSAELSVERELSLEEIDAFEQAAASLPPVVLAESGRQFRGMATIDDDVLWVYVHATGPGPCDERALARARDLARNLWSSIHSAAASTLAP